MKKLLIICFLLAFSRNFSQRKDTVNYNDRIVKLDLSTLFTTSEFNYGLSDEIVKKAQPIGYIGNNYQRFFIHFVSVIKNSSKPTKYYVYGKTKVKDNICPFQGTLKIESSKVFYDLDFPKTKQGIIYGTYEFYENSNQKGTGILSGKFETNFYIDKSDKLKYNVLKFSADGFCNNMFQGVWTSYKTKKSKQCNWGDYRIPLSDDLDIGAGEFVVNPDYEEFGWKNYMRAYFNSNKLEAKKALEIENQNWWNKKK